MCTCQISWIDTKGNPTPDENPAVGYCYRERYVDNTLPTPIVFERTDNYLVCQSHLTRMISSPHWNFLTFQEMATFRPESK